MIQEVWGKRRSSLKMNNREERQLPGQTRPRAEVTGVQTGPGPGLALPFIGTEAQVSLFSNPTESTKY